MSMPIFWEILKKNIINLWSAEFSLREVKVKSFRKPIIFKHYSPMNFINMNSILDKSQVILNPCQNTKAASSAEYSDLWNSLANTIIQT